MKIIWLILLIVSSTLLLGVLLRNKLNGGWFRGFALHVVTAAGLLYFTNATGSIEGLHIPINPITISTTVVLGIPGVLLLAGLQLFVV